ncbi:hypothetical protein L6E12_26955 [Actinokineospora sp. PR83]|uniref:hypothetical protein n=1 Tax=Actinokineospora sp. PR83 TaxID=2884908 RepID=UPI001F23EC04|nr:hypothetical protein [Actinokineospora sp. PR83]MCG8919420.1 hypothetical protein [Actinokineospora sp. PR83]
MNPAPIPVSVGKFIGETAKLVAHTPLTPQTRATVRRIESRLLTFPSTGQLPTWEELKALVTLTAPQDLTKWRRRLVRAESALKARQLSRMNPPVVKVVLTPEELIARSPAELSALLALVLDKAGLTAGQVAVKTGLPRSTAYTLIKPDDSLPSTVEQIQALLCGCGLEPSQIQKVMDLWADLHRARITALRKKAAPEGPDTGTPAGSPAPVARETTAPVHDDRAAIIDRRVRIAVAGFVARLEQVRSDSGNPTYRTMAQRGLVGHSSLNRVTRSPATMPTWTITAGWLRGCDRLDSDVITWRALWRESNDKVNALRELLTNDLPLPEETVEPTETAIPVDSTDPIEPTDTPQPRDPVAPAGGDPSPPSGVAHDGDDPVDDPRPVDDDCGPSSATTVRFRAALGPAPVRRRWVAAAVAALIVVATTVTLELAFGGSSTDNNKVGTSTGGSSTIATPPATPPAASTDAAATSPHTTNVAGTSPPRPPSAAASSSTATPLAPPAPSTPVGEVQAVLPKNVRVGMDQVATLTPTSNHFADPPEPGVLTGGGDHGPATVQFTRCVWSNPQKYLIPDEVLRFKTGIGQASGAGLRPAGPFTLHVAITILDARGATLAEHPVTLTADDYALVDLPITPAAHTLVLRNHATPADPDRCTDPAPGPKRATSTGLYFGWVDTGFWTS